MKRITLLIALGCGISTAMAAVHDVLPFESIQAKIDIAQPGDIVAISGGRYAEDLTINKAIRLVEMDGEDVTITGNVTFDSVTDPPAFCGFDVGSAGKGVIVNTTSGLILKDVDASAGQQLTVNGTSSVALVGGKYSELVQDGGELVVTGATVYGRFTATANSVKTVVFRSVVHIPGCNWSSQRAWIGYSNVWRFIFDGANARVVLVGNQMSSWTPLGGVAGVDNGRVLLRGANNDFTVINCVIGRVIWGQSSSVGDNGIILRENNRAFIANNAIIGIVTSPGTGSDTRGNAIVSASPDVKIMNNIVYGLYRVAHAPFGALSRNNCYYATTGNVRGGIDDAGSFAANPLVIQYYPPDLKLQAGSPCIDAGFDDPLYNDLDVGLFDEDRSGPRGGDRNNIGPSGGCWYDPEGWTTDKPVVISFDLGPERIREADNVEVRISEGLGVSQPAAAGP